MGFLDDIKKAGKDLARSLKDVKEAPFVREMCKTASNMYRLGWDERNGGNISYLLKEEEVAQYLDLNEVIRTIPLMGVNEVDFDASPLEGKIFIVTGTGKYFKNVEDDPETNLGIVRIGKGGKEVELLWGFKGGGRPTSEFPAHMMSHMARLSVDPENRVVMHSHPTNTLAMNFVHELDEKKFTHSLWEMCTECIVVFPEGVGVLPWMLCGTAEIGKATAQKMKEFRLVVWAMHGIYGAGKTPDETFGLIETVEKAAQIYMLTAHLPRVNTIKDEDMLKLLELFGVKNYRKDFLDL
ncbi:MAG TPA: rhamnulose-1-phosphate aldolase [Candidatus Coproplasma avistercoris]|nr:rhamnulose-1-phosphate aldolase [Candidatus Coproplasma avistercoris]